MNVKIDAGGIQSFEGILAAIDALVHYPDDIALYPRLRDIAAHLQIPSFVFVTFRFYPDGRTTHYRFLVGCDPEWIQIYQHRHWYSNDPYLHYARSNGTPTVGSRIPKTSAGQRDMCETAKKYGFRSNMVVPAYARATSLMGVLHVANDIALEDGGEERLLQWQTLLRAMAMSLLDARIAASRTHMVAKLSLDERDLTALRLVLAAEPAQDVAKFFGLSVASIYALYARINEKMGANRINEAARLAQQYDLL